MTRTIDLAAFLLGAAPLLGLAYAVNDLANGISEVPQHWWSSAALFGRGVAATLWLVPQLARS